MFGRVDVGGVGDLCVVGVGSIHILNVLRFRVYVGTLSLFHLVVVIAYLLFMAGGVFGFARIGMITWVLFVEVYVRPFSFCAEMGL